MANEPVTRTYSITQAMRRHKGVSRTVFRRMCNRGELLLSKHGSPDKIPLRELRAMDYLFAKKVGRDWQIPVEELNRLFFDR